MTIHVALLRAVNVGGRGMVAMSDLRGLFTALGFGEVRTLLQSGNVVFRGLAGDQRELERELERAAAERLGLHTHFMVRAAAEWTRIIAANPFREVAIRDPGRLVLMALKDRPARRQVDQLRSGYQGPERFEANGRELYIHYVNGIGRSKLANKLIESRLATQGTGRNWNTVLKLADQMRGGG